MQTRAMDPGMMKIISHRATDLKMTSPAMAKIANVRIGN